MLELHVLGTSSARFAHGRAVSGSVVNTPGGTLLVDCGEGMQQRLIDHVRQRLDAPVCIANSPATLTRPRTHGQWNRPGVMLYGSNPLEGELPPGVSLKPVMTLRSRLIAVQSLSGGEPVGYGARWYTSRPSRIGVVAAGYGDGYDRHAADGTPIARNGAITDEPVEVAALPPHVIHAFLATEDRRFYSHWGVDPRGIARAALTGTGGGSTITQQLAKFTFLTPERTLTRKAREALIAFWLESWLTKDDILSRYLSNAYFGDNVYGLRAASLHYFYRKPENLKPNQAAMLAGLLQVAGLLEVLGAGQMHAQDIAGQAAYFCRQVPYVRIALALIGESIDRAFGRGILLLFHQQVGFGKGQREVVRITLLQPTVALQCLRQSARIGVDLDLGEVDRQVIRCRFE